MADFLGLSGNPFALVCQDFCIDVFVASAVAAAVVFVVVLVAVSVVVVVVVVVVVDGVALVDVQAFGPLDIKTLRPSNFSTVFVLVVSVPAVLPEK